MRASPSQQPPAPDFERIRRVLTRCVHKVCPHDLKPSAEDIVQGAATQLWARMEAAGEPIDYGSAYLWRVANHAVIDEIRRRRRRHEELSTEVDHAPSGVGDPADDEHRRQILRGVRQCLAAAPKDRRAALGLYLQGFQLQEVAAALQCEAKRVDNLVYRGLAALRECLLGKGIRP